MSFDLSKLVSKSDLLLEKKELKEEDQEESSYTFKKQRLENQLLRKIANSKMPIKLRIGFLTEEDETLFQTELVNKGYTCSKSNGILTIE